MLTVEIDIHIRGCHFSKNGQVQPLLQKIFMQLGKKAVLGKNLAAWQENKIPTVKERDAISWLRKCVCQAHLRPVYT